MGLLVLLLDNEHPAAEVGPSVVQGLAELGVTGVAVLRDEQTTAVSLEGWAFDAARSAQAAARAVASDPGAVRILRPVVESSVSRRFEPRDPDGSQSNEAREAS
jgi:hypothetical protein